MTVPSPDGMRIQPAVPAWAMKTYRVASPLATHWRAATCEEVTCPHYLFGWATTVLPDSADEATIKASGRHWASREPQPGGFVRYTFPPGQPCFAASRHKVQVGRPELFYVQGGDWRGNPACLPTRQHVRGEDFIEDFGEHQQRIADAREKG